MYYFILLTFCLSFCTHQISLVMIIYKCISFGFYYTPTNQVWEYIILTLSLSVCPSLSIFSKQHASLFWNFVGCSITSWGCAYCQEFKFFGKNCRNDGWLTFAFFGIIWSEALFATSPKQLAGMLWNLMAC